MEYAILSQKGDRQINEDSVAFMEHNGICLFALDDGLGGHGHGEFASGIVTETAEIVCKDKTTETNDLRIIIQSVFDEAQQKLFQRQQHDADPSSYKTTAVVLAMDQSTIRWGYIGDSRLYFFYENKLIRRTLDHSVPQMMVNAGKLKEKKIRGHEDRNKLLRVLGTHYDCVKYVIEKPLLRDGNQAFLLCSDGFWEWIDEKRMIKFLKKSGSAQEWLDLMAEEVKKNGSGNHMDNFSAIAIIV
ncbi:MAG: protein phosphatase 2C domain-containing protein [Clostridia bacterium]|nr:protein phosphatase 2C domain-containing protein [Clostridia bacterium]